MAMVVLKNANKLSMVLLYKYYVIMGDELMVEYW